MKIRTCTTADLPEVYALFHATFGPLTQKAFRQRLLECNFEPSLSPVLEVNAKIEGFSLCARRGRAAFLMGLCVAAAAQNKGYGQRILQEQLLLLQHESIQQVRADARQDRKAAIALYEKLKFQKKKEIAAFKAGSHVIFNGKYMNEVQEMPLGVALKSPVISTSWRYAQLDCKSLGIKMYGEWVAWLKLHAESGTVLDFYVRPQYRRRGLGKSLLAQAQAVSKIPQLSALDMPLQPEVLFFAERLGFQLLFRQNSFFYSF